MHESTRNADPAELAKFTALAQSWWDPKGPSKPLHDLNPLRLQYIERAVALRGKPVLDGGCGGGKHDSGSSPMPVILDPSTLGKIPHWSGPFEALFADVEILRY